MTITPALSCSNFPLPPSQLCARGQILAIYGEDLPHDLLVPSLASILLYSSGLGVIDGTNRFDVYALTRWAHARQLDPRPLLTRLELSRAFTCHQLHRRVLTLDAAKTARWSLLCILGLLETFFDEDVRCTEAQRLLRECLAHLKDLSAHSLPILLTISAPSMPGREHFLNVVRTNVDLFWEPDHAAPGLELPRQLALGIGAESTRGA